MTKKELLAKMEEVEELWLDEKITLGVFTARRKELRAEINKLNKK